MLFERGDSATHRGRVSRAEIARALACTAPLRNLLAVSVGPTPKKAGADEDKEARVVAALAEKIDAAGGGGFVAWERLRVWARERAAQSAVGTLGDLLAPYKGAGRAGHR